MKKVSSIKVLDSLAEMTQYHDSDIIEKSLLKTINDAIPSKELKLFNVINNENLTTDAIPLQLICYAVNGHIDTLQLNFFQKQLSLPLQEAILLALETGDTQQVLSLDSDQHHILYPNIDQDGNVFSLLIQTCLDTSMDFDAPRYIYGLLKVYTNYLNLIQKSQTDKLTGLRNREALDKKMTHQLLQNSAKKQFTEQGGKIQRKVDAMSMWVGVLDIDYFKRINDDFGHLFGDEVLILVSRIMEKLLRTDDDVFRFGGEEFIILLKANSLIEAQGAFERIRRHIAQHEFPKIKHITVSIGVTEIKVQPGISNVVAEADTALYYAKENGRNKAIMYETLLEKGLVAANNSNIADDIELF